MKVGIVTLPLMANYGGILQNWALQQVLIRMGHQPLTLHRRWPATSKGTLRAAFAQFITDYMRVSWYSDKQVYASRKAPGLMEQFISSQIIRSDEFSVYTRKMLRREQINALVVGSDQVWRRGYNVFSQEMFLRFTKRERIRRIAYAASFGTDTPAYPWWLRILCKRYLHRFDAVSCREYEATSFCRDTFKVKAETVADPTMLLARKDYEELCKDIAPHDHKYVMAFMLDANEEKKAFVEKVAKEKGLKVIYVADGARLEYSIPQWLAFIRDAGYVVTDSYHGTVFSLIFQKQFVTIVNTERGTARFTTLARHFEIGDRLVDIHHVTTRHLEAPVDWKTVEERFDGLIKRSMFFLADSLNKG